MTRSSPPRRAVAVFARQPVPGRVKTRLARDLGAEAACRAYAELLERTLEAVAGVEEAHYLFLPPGDVIDTGRRGEGAFARREQRGAGLGERLAAAFRELFEAGHDAVALVGSDCPYLTPALLTAALDALAEHPAALGPAPDGGYYLVAQRAPGYDLFSGIDWSTERVWRQTLDRLRRCGLTHAELPPLEDVDRVDAWRRYLESRRGATSA